MYISIYAGQNWYNVGIGFLLAMERVGSSQETLKVMLVIYTCIHVLSTTISYCVAPNSWLLIWNNLKCSAMRCRL